MDRTPPAKERVSHRLPDEVLALRDRYVAVAGRPESAAVEHDPDPQKNDHVWITIDAGNFGSIQIALSTMSRRSRAGGFDPRVQVGTLRSRWVELPPAGVHETEGLDYGTLTREQLVSFAPFEREPLEQLLLTKADRAIFIEAWGEFFVRAYIGVHQIHSRRASFAVSQDFMGRDGAIRFYFDQSNESEMLLFKFAGQP